MTYDLGAARPRRQKKRIPIARARRIAREIERFLRPFSKALVVAGSIRRGLQEVGDVEFVVLPKDLDEFVEILEEEGFRVGPSIRKATTVVNRVPVELYIAHGREELGSMLLRRTGDWQMNIAMSAQAKRMGYLLNEYGIWTPEGEPVLQSPDEREFFDFLGIDWHWPEERSLATRTPEERRRRAAKKPSRKKRRKRVARMGYDQELDHLHRTLWREDS